MKDQQEMNAIAGITGDRQQAEEWSLALAALGIPHEVVEAGRQWLVLVRPRQVMTARRELAGVDHEDLARLVPADRAEAAPPEVTPNPPTILLMGGLLLFYVITGPWVDDNIWFEQGMVASERMLGEHEWWRAVTGLTLHADPVHLLGNLLIGGLLIHFFCRSLGTGLGWFLIIATGVVGNAVNAWMHGPGHHAVGFSTAVFGTVGLLTGLQSGRRRRLPLKEIALPLAAGVGLLAMLGAGGERTDLGAHLFGLLVGMVAGVALGLIPDLARRVAPAWIQAGLLLVTLLTVWLGWRMALS